MNNSVFVIYRQLFSKPPSFSLLRIGHTPVLMTNAVHIMVAFAVMLFISLTSDYQFDGVKLIELLFISKYYGNKFI